VTETTAEGFVRARRPEQREVRRRAILDAAEALLGELPMADISLRELSRRAGLATSNVLRYFESREAVFLELLARERGLWLDALPSELPPRPQRADSATYSVDVFARAYADSIARRPLLCEMASAMSSVLERNVSVEVVRLFKRAALADNRRLAAILADRVPGLGEAAALELASTVTVLVSGLWPLANPGPAVIEAIEDEDLHAAHVDFAGRLSRMTALLTDSLRR
jgi:AcrR family transcriptional regulator